MKWCQILLYFAFTFAVASGNSAEDAMPPRSMKSDRAANFYVGGLVPVHIAVANKTLCMLGNAKYSFIRRKNSTAICYRINDSGVLWSEALRFAVLQVNKLKLLGDGVTLGYDIRDSVNNVDVALEAAMDFTTMRRWTSTTAGANGSSRKCACRANDTEPYVVSLIGGARSEISQRVNHVLGACTLPQISYSSTSVSLSDKRIYSTFLRTIPPDNYQARAMADIAHHFGWNYVATVATDEDYGRQGVKGFHQEARKFNICISQHHMFHFNISSRDSKKQITRIVRELKRDLKTKVIVLFCERPRAKAVLEEAERQGMTGKTWIATEDWGFSDKVYHVNAAVVGGVLGVVTYTTAIESFGKYLDGLKAESDHGNPWLTEYFDMVRGGKTMRGLNAGMLHRNKAAYVMDSVYTVAHGLRAYLKCKAARKPECPEQMDLTKLREFMLAVNFTGAFQSTVAFDKDGNPEGKYQISNMQPDSSTKHKQKFVLVGNWINGKLTFTKPIVWNGRKNDTPVSRCASPCSPGKYYVSTAVSCCWECVPCPAGKFKVGAGNRGCDACRTGYVSNENRTQCLRIPEEFIRWDSITSAILVSLASLGVLITSFMFGVYFLCRKTPIVKASSRYPSLFLLVAIALMFALPLLYIGRPNSHQCHAQPIAFGCLMTLATSLVLSKTFRLIQIFNNVVSNLRDKPLVNVRTQFAIVSCFLVVEAIVIVVFLESNPIEVRMIVRDSAVPVDCGQSAKDLHVVVLLYNGLLAIICAGMAFRARSLPANFSEARLISFAMFTFSVIWLVFLIAFTGSLISGLSTFICVAILATALDLLVCMFVPKVWVILFRPELNAMHVVRADIYRYTMKQRARSHGQQMDSSENEMTRSRTYSLPDCASPKVIQDLSCQESKL